MSTTSMNRFSTPHNVVNMNDVIDSLERYNKGFGAPEEEIVSLLMKEKGNTVNPQQIYQVIDELAADGILVYPLGSNGPVAITDIISPFLSNMPDEFTPFERIFLEIVDYLDRHPEVNISIGTVDDGAALMRDLRLMTDLGYIETDGKLNIRVAEPIYNARHGIVTPEPAITKTPVTKTTVKKTDGVKTPRDPTPYNLYMKDEIARLKAAGMKDHKKAFNQAAANWGTAPENPKNQK